ncbi:Four and a half LIM domains protein 3, partial [Xenoophorus captivus]
ELFYEDRHYHEHCFRCFRCDRSLADEPFTSQDDALLCNDCYCNEFSSKCVACDKIVMPGKRENICNYFLTNLMKKIVWPPFESRQSK